MTAISKQVKELREYADNISSVFKEDLDILKGTFEEAADTIEALSVKLAAAQYGDGWIYCGDGKNLPKEKINPVTGDYFEYQVTFQNEDITDIRHYKFGDGHWWNCGEKMDPYVIAYRIPVSPCTEHKRQPKVTPDSANAMSRWKDDLLNRFTKVV